MPDLESAAAALTKMSSILQEIRRSVSEVTRTYRDALTNWVYETMGGRMTAIDLRRAHKALIRSVAQDAYFEGMRQGGILSPADEATDKDFASIKEWIAGQTSFVDDFAKAVSDVAGDGTKRAGILNRLEMWVNSVTGLGQAGYLSAKSDRPAIWHLGPTETHCKTCIDLDGKRHRVSWFLKHGYLPHTPGNAVLECQGWGHCFISDAVSGERLEV